MFVWGGEIGKTKPVIHLHTLTLTFTHLAENHHLRIYRFRLNITLNIKWVVAVVILLIFRLFCFNYNIIRWSIKFFNFAFKKKNYFHYFHYQVLFCNNYLLLDIIHNRFKVLLKIDINTTTKNDDTNDTSIYPSIDWHVKHSIL